MRSSRVKRYRKKHRKLINVIKSMIVCYSIILSFSLITSNTEAYYSDSSEVKTTISSFEEFRDYSNLQFTEGGAKNIKVCPPTDISVNIKNSGSSMYDTSSYEVYFSRTGNPAENGEKVYDGTIHPIESNGESELTYTVELDGWYIFKAYQRPGYNNDYENRHAVWSEKIKIQCIGKGKESEDQLEQSDNNENVETDVSGKSDNQDDSDNADTSNDSNVTNPNNDVGEDDGSKPESEDNAEDSLPDKFNETEESDSTNEQNNPNNDTTEDITVNDEEIESTQEDLMAKEE